VVRFTEDGSRTVLSTCGWRITEKYIAERVREWSVAFQGMIKDARKHGTLGMVAIEDARPRGRGGANMQYLGRTLKDQAIMLGVRSEMIPVATVKKSATGNGHASTKEVAMIVRAEYALKPGIAIINGEYDVEMAIAIAGAGYDILVMEALEALCD